MFHSKGGGSALIFCDTLFNVTELPPRAGFSGWFLLKFVFGSVGPLGVSRMGRWMFVKDRKVLAEWIESIIPRGEEGKLKVIGVAHGHTITGYEECSSSLNDAVKRIRG